MSRSSVPGASFVLVDSPIGPLGLVAGKRGLAEILSGGEEAQLRREIARRHPGAGEEMTDPVLRETARQLTEFFSGRRLRFDLPLDVGNVSPFMTGVLAALGEIPCGETRTYGELARGLGRPGAARAVGRALAANPLPIVIPCHRVVGHRGELTGYSGGDGIRTKQWLLAFEAGLCAQPAEISGRNDKIS